MWMLLLTELQLNLNKERRTILTCHLYRHNYQEIDKYKYSVGNSIGNS
jgi:hypothetical protein